MPIRPYDTSTAAETAAHNGADDMTPDPFADCTVDMLEALEMFCGETAETDDK